MFFHLIRCPASSIAWPLKFRRVRRRKPRNRLQLHEVVHDEVALHHPIVSLSRNMCNLVNANKLSTLSVSTLKDICESLRLNVDNIKQRRKKPLIEQISQVVGVCSCSRKWQQSDWTTKKTIERQNKSLFFLNRLLLFPALFGTYTLMFQEYHALPVQAPTECYTNSPDTVEEMMAMFLSWRGLLQQSFMKFQQNN